LLTLEAITSILCAVRKHSYL